MPTDATYYKRPEESVDQYNQRFAHLTAKPPAAPAPINRTINDPAQANSNGTSGTTAADDFLNTFRAPESRDQIAERKRQQSQGLIDSINKTFDDQVAERRKIGDQRLGLDNAISVITGNTGGSEAVASRTRTLDANDKEVQAVNNQRALELSKVYTQISGDADREAREQLADATKSAEAVVARRKESQTQAVENIKLMAAGGLVDFDAFASSPQNAKVYQYALDSVGGSEQSLRALFMLNRPKDQLVGEPVRMGNKYVQAYSNPITGKVTYEQLDLPFDLPPEYSSFQQMGNNLVAVPDNWDGDISKLKTVYSETPGAGKRDTQVVETSDGRKILIDSQTGEEIKTVGGNAPTNNRVTAIADDAMKAITDLEGMSGQKGAVGAKGASSLFGYKDKPIAGTAAAGYLAQLDRVKALLTLPNLQYMKGLGAMSDREFNTISASVAALNPDMKESAFTTELTRIKDALQTTTLASQLQPGEILVKDTATGQIGAIPEGEFDPNKYERQ